MLALSCSLTKYDHLQNSDIRNKDRCTSCGRFVGEHPGVLVVRSLRLFSFFSYLFFLFSFHFLFLSVMRASPFLFLFLVIVCTFVYFPCSLFHGHCILSYVVLSAFLLVCWFFTHLRSDSCLVESCFPSLLFFSPFADMFCLIRILSSHFGFFSFFAPFEVICSIMVTFCWYYLFSGHFFNFCR